MYNNSNGGVEHEDSTTNASKEAVSHAEAKSDVLTAEKPADAEAKAGSSEVTAEHEEEEALAQDGATETEEHSVVEIIEKTNPDDEAEENVEHLEEAEHLDEEALESKQDEHVTDGEDDKKIIIEVLHEVNTEKETGANVSYEEKSTMNLEMCRVCMGTEELTDIFQLEGPIRVSDIIMKVCTNIRITARDHLPHKICERCVGQVRIVNEFKTRCEASDKELRKNLKRSTNKSRRSSDFIVVNCPMSDSDKDDDEPVDDDEYKVSQSEVESEPATSDDSFSPPNKRKRTPKRRGRTPGSGRRGRPGRKPKNITTSAPALATYTPKRGPGRPPKYPKTPSLTNIVYIEAPEDSSSSDGEEEVKRKRRKRGDNPCPKCDEVLPSQHALKQHLRSHPSDRFNCDRCTLFYRTERALQNHIERHKKADRIREEKVKEREQRIEQRLRETPKQSDHEKSKLTSSVGSVGSQKKIKTEPSPATSGRDLFNILEKIMLEQKKTVFIVLSTTNTKSTIRVNTLR
uniref:Uncharacterized protein n=1 Tax=Anopheles dirus TaxID=7168 RepID=A0A182NV17_9DIPT